MDHFAAILFGVIRTERALDEMPASQERRRLVRLAAEIAQCCRVSFAGRLIAALDGRAIAATGAVR
jgi:hypothetical protein